MKVAFALLPALDQLFLVSLEHASFGIILLLFDEQYFLEYVHLGTPNY